MNGSWGEQTFLQNLPSATEVTLFDVQLLVAALSDAELPDLNHPWRCQCLLEKAVVCMLSCMRCDGTVRVHVYVSHLSGPPATNLTCRPEQHIERQPIRNAIPSDG